MGLRFGSPGAFLCAFGATEGRRIAGDLIMQCIYLAANFAVWCRALPTGGWRCLVPASGIAPLETVEVSAAEPVAVVWPQDEAPFADAERVGLRELVDRVPASEHGVAVRAVPLAEWRRSARFCGVCGSPLQRSERERAMECAACGQRVYPRINPVVITRVTRGDEVLLARRAASPGGFFSIIAGFLEPGETLEEGVAREILEETGVRVRDIRYACSQPWPFPSNVMIAFTAAYAGGEVRPDGVEMAEAGWFRRDALPKLPGPHSVARRLIDAWCRTGCGPERGV